MAEEKKIATGYIGNALRSAADNHTTTFADEIFDTERQKYQSEVNTDLETTDNEIKAGLEAETARATTAEEANATAIADGKNTIMDLSRELYGSIFDKYNKFTLIGDSISTFAGYIPSNYKTYYPKGKIDSVDKTYWFSLAQKLGCVVQNLSAGGSTVTNKSSVSLPNRALLVDSDSDLIIIALGANDTNTESNEELNYSKELSDYDESIFTEAYIKGLRIILANNPNSDVLLITIDKPGRNPNNAVVTKAIAEHYGVMYLDIRGIYDGELHPDVDTTDDGSEMLDISDAIVDSLISNNNKNGLRNTVAKIEDQISGHIGTYISECKSYKVDNPILLTHINHLFSADSISITTNENKFQSVDWYFNYPTIGERIKLTITDRANGNDIIASFRFYDCEFDGSKVDDSHIIINKDITKTGSISLEVPANAKCVVVIFHATFGTGLAEDTKVVFSGIKIEYETVDVTYVDSKGYVSVKTDADGKILEATKLDGTKVFGGNIESPTITELRQDIAKEKSAIIGTNRIADGAVTYDKMQAEIKEVVKNITYKENPKFVYVITDTDDKLLWWIEKDGSVGWSKGIPIHIQEELKKLEQLIKDNTENVVAINKALNKKVDGVYVNNSKYIRVITDFDDKILEATKLDGTKVFGGNIESPTITELREEIYYKSETREESITNSLSSHGKRVMSFDEEGGVNFKFGVENSKERLGIDLSLNYIHKNMRYVWVYMQQQAPYDDKHWGMACSVSDDAIHWENIKEDGGCVLDMGTTSYGGYLRDPSLIKVGDVFYSAFTYNIGLDDYKYGIAKSTDLYNWTVCGMVKCKYNGGYILAGAPEILYIDNKVYVIFQGDINNGVFLGRSLCYLQEIPQSFLDGENTDIELECQYIDLGTCAIDYYIIKKDSSYYLFSDVGWMPIIYKGETITGPYELVNYLPQINAEGYCVFEVDGIYYLYVTGGSTKGVKMLKSSDLINWTGLNEISTSYRHGSIVAIKPKIDVNKILNEIL